MPAGRPNKYTKLMAEAICEQIAIGRSIIQITNDPDFPSETTVYRWLRENEQFQQEYAHARELQAEHYAAEIVALADTPVEARKVTIKADGSEEITIGDAVDRSRLQIDSRKWIAMKLLPKKYGDKLAHTGADGEGPVSFLVKSILDK
jgi:hypothetical protein